MHERAPVGMEAARLLTEIGDGDPPTAVTVAVAADVDLATARDAWESATAGTPLSGATVDWVVEKATLVCLTCATEYTGDKLDRCPACSGDGLIVDDPPIARVVGWSTSNR